MTHINCPSCSRQLAPDALRCARCGEVVAELPADSLVGQTVGDVKIRSAVRSTPYALTFEGVQEGIGRHVRVKLMAVVPTASGPPKSLIREMQALSKLRHANILSLYNVGLFRKRYPFMVTESLQGGTLRDLLSGGAMGPVRALGVIQQVASALEAVHDQDMLHQNLSPEGIALEELAGSGQILAKISDFRVVRLDPLKHGEADAAGSFETSPYYMPPEQVLGAEQTQASDLYSVGVILYEMLTGSLPYANREPPALWDDVVGSAPAPLATKQPALAAIPQLQSLLDKLLAKKPSGRLGSARDLRLLTTRMREDLVSLGLDDEAGAEAFPVLETAARIRPIPKGARRQAPSGSQPIALESKDVQEVRPPAPPPVESMVSTGEIQVLDWRAIVPQRLGRAKGEPYLVIAAVAIASGQTVSSDFGAGAEILLQSTVNLSERLVAVTSPLNALVWLRRLVQRAQLDGLSVGLGFARHFPGGRGAAPSRRCSRLALDAARRGDRGWLLVGPHAVEELGIADHTEPCLSDAFGKPTSFFRFIP